MDSDNHQDSNRFPKPMVEHNNFFPNSGNNSIEKYSLDKSNHSNDSPYAGVLLNSAIIGKEFQANEPKSESNSALISSRNNTSFNKKPSQTKSYAYSIHKQEKLPIAIDNQSDPIQNSDSHVQPSNDSGPLIKKDSELGTSGMTQVQSTPNVKQTNSQDNQKSEPNERKESDDQILDNTNNLNRLGLRNNSQIQTSKVSPNSLVKLPPINTKGSAPVSKNSSSLQIRRQLQKRLKDLNQVQRNPELHDFIENTSDVKSIGKLKSEEFQDDSHNLSLHGSRNHEKEEEDEEKNRVDRAQHQPEEHPTRKSKKRGSDMQMKNYSQIPAKMEPPQSYFKNYSYILPKKNSIMPLPINSSNVMGESPIAQGKVIDLTTPGLPLGEGKEIMPKKDLEGKLSGYEKLELMKGFIFKQKFQVFKDEKGWEPPFRTYVHNLNPAQEDAGKRMFQCNEASGCCARQCLSAYCRPFTAVVNTCNPGEDPDSHQPFLMIERTCNFSCLWFNRPAITIKRIEDGRDEFLGIIKDVFAWGSIELEVYDKNNSLRYVISGSCCQWGLTCNCSCQSCHNVEFLVKPVNCGKILELTKKNTQFSKTEFPNAERYNIGFSSTTSSEDKALLMCAILFLEARHFEGDQ